MSKDRLGQLPLPAIALWEDRHWLVVYQATARHVRVADPASGLKRLPRAVFEQGWSGHAALIDPPEQAAKAAPQAQPWQPWAVLRSLLKTALPHHSRLMAVLLGTTLLELTLPVLAQISVAQALQQAGAPWLFGPLFGVLLMVALARLWQSWLLSAATARLDTTTTTRLADRLFELPLSYFRSRGPDELRQRLAASGQLREFLLRHGSTALGAAIQLPLAWLLLGYYSQRLAGLAAGCGLLAVCLARALIILFLPAGRGLAAHATFA